MMLKHSSVTPSSQQYPSASALTGSNNDRLPASDNSTTNLQSLAQVTKSNQSKIFNSSTTSIQQKQIPFQLGYDYRMHANKP